MRLTKLALLGLCALILGLMAFGTSAAQAEPGNAWVILNPEKTLVKKPLLPVLGAQLESGTEGLLLATVLNGTINLVIHCSAIQLVGVHLEEEGKLTNGGKVKFTGCKVLINGTEEPECEVHSAGEPVGTVSTNPGKGLLKLHLFPKKELKDKTIDPEKTELVTVVEPRNKKEGEKEEGGPEPFVTLLMGEGCVIGEEVPIEGKFVIRDCELKASEHLVTHLIEEEPELTLLHVLDDLHAKIDGSALVSLTGEHKGLKWAGEMP